MAVLTDEHFNLRDLKTGPPGNGPAKTLLSTFTVGLISPTTQPGTVEVFVSVGEA